MKKNTLLNKLALIVSLSVIVLGCDGGDEDMIYADFVTIASSYYENDGPGTVTIPLRNAASAANNLEFSLGGTAFEGEDFEVIGMDENGINLSILDDSEFEANETVRILLSSPSGELKGNTAHTLTIVSNCEDTDGLDSDFFVADFDANEINAPDDIYGPYHITLEQDEIDPNIYWMDNFWDSGLHAYLVYDPATKTISFPQQIPVPTFPTRIITSDKAVVTDNCRIVITTHYRGLTWDYEFIRHQFTTD